jgi:hypothetical protein
VGSSFLRAATASLAGTALLVAVAVGGMRATGAAASPAQATALPVGEVRPGLHLPFRDGPPARVTGGFGEDSCYACHWDGTENDEVGSLRVSGFPERFEPGASYPLELVLARPGMAVAGFQLAVRHAEDTTQAGRLEVPESEKGRVGILTEREVQFAHHLLPGIEPASADTARWSVMWTAPEGSEARVLLHVSAVAGDDDESQMGDAVYTLELASRPDPGALAGPSRGRAVPPAPAGAHRPGDRRRDG